MVAGFLWFALLTAAMLCYPRRPRVAGLLWIALGTLSLLQSYTQSARLGATSGLFFIGLGIWYLVKYRDAIVRAKHVEYWTAKA
jgi:hypothetical protein